MDDMYSGMWTVLEAIRNMWINVWDFIGNYAQGTLNWVLDMVSRGWDAIRDLGSEWFGGWAAGGVLQAFAEGGTVKHQMALVGERGPEAIALPNGTRVMPHGEMRTALGQGIAPDESENGDTQQLTNSITQLNSLLLQVGNRIGKSIEGIAFSTRVNANLLSIIIQAAQIQSKFINVVQQSNSLLTASIKSRMMESPSIQIHIDTINERSDVDSLYDYMMQKLSGDIATAQTT